MTALYNIPTIALTCLSGYLASVALVGVNSGTFISTFFARRRPGGEASDPIQGRGS